MMFFRSSVLILCFLCPGVWAAEPFSELKLETSQLKQKYLTGLLASLQIADEAVGASAKLQFRLERWYLESESACYSEFFVNACLQDVKLKRRQLLPDLKEIEFAAKDFKRQSKILAGDQRSVSEQMK
ncbi:hypothetical protein [Undibacterium luofuense]|uniref:Uncharacterized protein n=1 Tax=Undibacterium luofuense TaxID=2828733 RepID=A0A941DN79_9BURK|nr:hypothetical protein [Undibacterium luofuense]MBR7783119.1 hypothetical protein [Undibacterium luofuense]